MHFFARLARKQMPVVLLHSLLLLFSLLLPLRLMASGGYPLLFNYTFEQYGSDADLQNWDITQSEAGEIFVGNNNCMLRFDGNNWQKISSYGDRIYRSTCAVGDRIYLGRHDEFGYLKRNSLGHYDFTSISADKPVMKENEEIWNILQVGERVYFQSFTALYAYENDSLETVRLGYMPFLTFSDGKALFVQAFGGHFYKVDAQGGSTLMYSQEDISGGQTVGFFALPEADTYLIVSSNRGLYTWKRGAIERMQTEADGLLGQFAVNKACRTHRGNIVLGTYRSGIICLSPEGKLLWHYNSDTGLRNDCVLRLFCDREDNIWACMDDGIALIANGSPYRIIGDKIGNQSIGMVYGLSRQGKDLYIATNQGVYSCCPDELIPSPELMRGTEGQNWHLTDIDGTLYCGHNAKLLQLSDRRFTEVPGTQSSSTCIRSLARRNEHFLIESSYSELRIHKGRQGGWDRPYVVEGFQHPIRQIEVDNEGNIWAADMSVGVCRITLSDDMRKAESVDYFPEIDSISGRCFVMRLGANVLISNGARLYRYDDDRSMFVRFDRLNNILPLSEGIISITESGRSSYWIGSKNGYALVSKNGDNWQLNRTIRTASLGYRSNNVSAGVYEHDSLIYLGLSDAVVIYDPRLEQEHAPARFFLFQAHHINRRGQFADLDTERLLSGKARISGNMFLRFSYPKYPSEDIRFEFEIKGLRSTKTITSTTPEVLLTGIPNGRKHLTAKAVAPDGTVLAEVSFSFRVLPPWYRRWWAFVIYFILIMLFAQVLVRYQVKKKTERQRLQLLEQDRIISEQKQQLLENELALKSKDLASLSLDAALKDNVIDSIQHAIKQQQKQGNIAQGAFNAELLRIRQTTGNEKNWAVFQQNFDLIHEHFFRHLKEQYPQLTTSDLRLCALLRLNMATKDIATYTGLSVRGVESARFRLRKKLGLDAEQNLSEFLLAFK